MDLNNPSPSLFMGSNDDDPSSFGWNGLGFSSSAETTAAATKASDACQGMREDDCMSPGRGSSRLEVIMKNVEINRLELWKEGDRVATVVEPERTIDPVKWNNMSTKMSLMRKVGKNPDHDGSTLGVAASNGSSEHEFDDLNMLHRSSYSETKFDGLSPVRVCSDCNTTKTPLWRSGPKGPKSLCNACGIRQRKARRALAAALTCGGRAVVATGQPLASKIKVQHKGKASSKNGLMALQLKKRCKMTDVTATTTATTDTAITTTIGSQFNGKIQKPRLEEFLIKLGQKIAFNRVCPQDEKDAAILLMALSSGLVHG